MKAKFGALVLLSATALACAAAQDPASKPPHPMELTEKAAKEYAEKLEKGNAQRDGPALKPSQPIELTEKAHAEKLAKENAQRDAETEALRKKAAEWDARNPSAYALEQQRRQLVGLTLFWLALLCSLGALIAPWFMIRRGRWPMAVTASGLTLAGTVFPAFHIWFGDAGHEILINGLFILLSWVLSFGLIVWAGVGEVGRADSRQ